MPESTHRYLKICIEDVAMFVILTSEGCLDKGRV